MTEYTDIPLISDLYVEQQQVQTAIYNLESSGAIINMTVAPPSDPSIPPPAPMGSSNDPFEVPSEPPVPMATVSVIIALNLPNPPDLVASAITALKARDDAITAELASMGVINTPVRR